MNVVVRQFRDLVSNHLYRIRRVDARDAIVEVETRPGEFEATDDRVAARVYMLAFLSQCDFIGALHGRFQGHVEADLTEESLEAIE